MSLSPLFSRKIKEIKYNSETELLTIVLGAGISKKYSGVPENVYNELVDSKEPNRYYEEKINGQFKILN
jgi:hypothetical protein